MKRRAEVVLALQVWYSERRFRLPRPSVCIRS